MREGVSSSFKWCEAKAAGEEMADVIEVDILVPNRASLAGEELRDFLAAEEAMLLVSGE